MHHLSIGSVAHIDRLQRALQMGPSEEVITGLAGEDGCGEATDSTIDGSKERNENAA